MESLEAKKVRLLGKWITDNGLANCINKEHADIQGINNAIAIISLLNDVEQSYWITREEADFQTHCSEVYGD